ncbi:lanthionine synthetase C family protein [Streptomyces erythrochromogenes]|uniref:lanthionine synthetase C family protein n=1 Tax=Streptomyces erythrochromogenes TaxID=285574 RepID=UPI003430500B
MRPVTAPRPELEPEPAPVLTGDTAGRALQVVQRVARQLADPERVEAVLRAGRRPDSGAVVPPPDLGQGPLGAALLFGELARTDESMRPLAHRAIARAAKGLSTAPGLGLFGGPAALLAVAQTCADGAGDYQGLRAGLARRLARRRNEHPAPAGAPGSGVAWSDYDWIQGPAGTTRLLLDCVEDPDESGPDITRALESSLRRLTALTEPVRVNGRTVSGWWIAPGRQATAELRATFPDGFFDLGIAHGIGGPLSVLATALERGREVEGQREAVERIVDWLAGRLLHDEAGPYWPAWLSWAEETTAERPATAYTRNAWCYGSPSVAAALYRAGTALGRPEWCRNAVTVLNAALARDQDRWELEGPTLCHGYAGFLQILTRTALSSGDRGLAAGCRRLAGALLDQADDDAPFTFRRLTGDSTQAGTPTASAAFDSPGMLEGAAGAACALLSATRTAAHTGRSAHPWDRTLGLV